MYTSILSDFLQIKSYIFRLFEKHNIADNRKSYTRAIGIFQGVLKDTVKRLESSYYDCVLAPQINETHSHYKETLVKLASIVVIMYITSLHPRA